jgi:DNA-binding response OmpR family regulator
MGVCADLTYARHRIRSVRRKRAATTVGGIMRVLVVDGDRDLLDVMTYSFRREGYEVVAATSGPQALDRFRDDHPEIVVLDLKLPRLDGFEVCRRIRLDSEVPVIVVSSSPEEQDVLRALRLGADDYVTKPFSLKQLAARMETVLRRCRRNAYERAARTVRAGDLELSLESYEVTRGGDPVQLTPLEFRILYMLAMNEGQVIPYSRLVDYAWGYEGGDASMLKTHICHIRQKLGLSLGGPGAIRSLPTVGYSLVKQRAASGAPSMARSGAAGRARDEQLIAV